MVREIENCKPSRRFRIRWAFTLVEVLVVIAIIGLLVGLLLPAINGARKRAKLFRIKAEIAQLTTAIEEFRQKIGGGQYPPDGTNANDVQRFLKAAFPRVAWGSGGVPYPTNISPDTALVFWLGGAQDATGAFIGFSANPANPFDGRASRLPVFYEFDKANPANPAGARLNYTAALAGPPAPGNGVTLNLYQFYCQNDRPVSESAPYLYFKAVAGLYTKDPFANTLPFADSTAASQPAFINPKSFQIICPGLDGKFGTYAASGWPQYPAGTTYKTETLDDMTSFATGSTVGDDVP
jgi:prepilin-type N-terminal cleavage/methylation domain-containing protein